MRNDSVQHILPSLLSADPMHLADEISALMQAGINRVHLDIMDHHYVPNLTFGPHIAQGIRQCFPSLEIDVHLMTQPVDALIEQFAAAGANRISIHPEATLHLDRSLTLIKSLGCQVGLALNPSTAFESFAWCAHRLDFILMMTVNPGFGGQAFIPELVPKISKLHQQYPSLTLCVDGGVNAQNIATIAKAGAQEFVIGSALFQGKNYTKTIKTMLQSLHTIS